MPQRPGDARGKKTTLFCTIVMRNITIAHFTLHVHHT